MGSEYNLYDVTTKRALDIGKARDLLGFTFSDGTDPFSGVTATKVREFVASGEADDVEHWTAIADWMGDGAVWKLWGDVRDNDSPYHDENGDERADWTFYEMRWDGERSVVVALPTAAPYRPAAVVLHIAQREALQRRVEHHLLHGSAPFPAPVATNIHALDLNLHVSARSLLATPTTVRSLSTKWP